MFFTSQEEYDRARMNVKASIDMIYEFIESLDAQQTWCLYHMLMSGDEPKSHGINLGIILGRLRMKFSACLCHNQPGFHTEQDHLLDGTEDVQPQSVPVTDTTGVSEVLDQMQTFEFDGRTVRYSPTTWTLGDTDLPEDIASRIDYFLDQYHLTALVLPEDNSDPITSGAYQCRRCKMTYPSLKDRMLKGPEDCQYCQIQAGHGGASPFDD